VQSQQARAAVPPLVGLVVALAVVELTRRPAPSATVGRSPATLAGTSPRDCAPCHAREVAEWRGSVMSMAARSPLVGALESFVEEQVGREASCPNGAGVLRKQGRDVCENERSGVVTTGAGGEQWCVNCHAPGENFRASMPAWAAHGRSGNRAPMRDLLDASGLEGVSCATCHSTVGPVATHASARRRGEYDGNATWTSPETGATFFARPEDAIGRTGIGNSGYSLDDRLLLGVADTELGRVHPQPPPSAERYLASSAMCGACHDVRLFGTDTRGVLRTGEHFKRLRNAYSEWRAWAEQEARAGRTAPSCQDCHMSLYPGTCERDGTSAADEQSAGCPPGFRFRPRRPGEYATAHVATSSPQATRVASHWFTGVDLPLSSDVGDESIEEQSLDPDGVPVGARARRDLLLRHTFRFAVGTPFRRGARVDIPIEIENVGAGHRVPAGFSQEREIWVHLRVADAIGATVYEVGRIDRPDEDLRDKVFARVTTSGAAELDARLRPLGLFGADVLDGLDVPAWSPDPRLGGTRFIGRGLINLQNGFQRCVRCIGVVDAAGRCTPVTGQGLTRADRFADGDYDLDTGECRSNLQGDDALFETYFPVGALDAERGVAKAPDAIIDTRSAPPGVPLSYTYEIDAGAHPAPFAIEARLMFRAFPPYLVRAFAEYEAAQARAGLRPSGAQVERRMLARDEPVEIGLARTALP
jgi:hypothetical protein